MSYSHMGTPTLPSALLRFTSEFGMGSGGTTVLLSLSEIVNLGKRLYIQSYSSLCVRDFIFCQSSYNLKTTWVLYG